MFKLYQAVGFQYVLHIQMGNGIPLDQPRGTLGSPAFGTFFTSVGVFSSGFGELNGERKNCQHEVDWLVTVQATLIIILYPIFY